MRRASVLLLLSILLASTVIAAYTLLPKEKEKLVVGTIQGGISTLDLIEEDWITVRKFDKSLDLAQALSKGEVDVAVITSEMYAKFAIKNKKLKIIAADMFQNQAIIGVSDLSELRGRKLGAVTASGTYAMFISYAKLSGLVLDEVRVVDAPLPQLVQAFGKGEIDAILCWEPLASKLIAKGYKHVDFSELSEKYVGGDVVMLVWVANEEVLRKPELIEFLKLRNDAAEKWESEAPERLKKIYDLSEEEVRVLMNRVKIIRGDLKDYEEAVISAWKLALMGGYLENERSIEELAKISFWEG